MSDLFNGLSSFTKSVNEALNSYEMRKIGDKVQSFVLNFTEVELKVREATNEDPWGPTGPQMQEIAQLTFQYDAFPEIMGMLWKRMLQDNKLAWRRVYKSLILLNNLLKTGSERVINNAKDHLFEMRALESYNCVDERGRDQGVNIRHRVKQIIELLQDDELLVHERQKTRSENKEKYQGFSKEDMLYKGKVSSFESWNENKFRSSKSDFDFPETRSGREASSYDFDQNRSASPDELGIPDNSYHRHKNQPENNEDDEFGDFADARSSTTNNQQHATNNTSNANDDLFGGGFSSPTNNVPSNNRLPKPPSVPTSPVPKNSSQPVQNNVGNLFDLDFNDAQPVAPTFNHTNGNGLDLFGESIPVTQNNIDIFGDFTAPTPIVAQPVRNSRPSNDFDIFGDFSSPAPPVVSSNTPDGWGDLMMPTPVQQQPSKPVVQAKAPEPKLGDGWSFLEAQLDGLTAGNKQKAAPTMNELRTQKM